MKDLSFLEQISMAVQDPAGADAELLRDIAAEYAEAVVAVNERLMQIGVLLNKGLRGEALQAADRSPKILDLVTKLDFPELESWNAMLVELKLPAPPRLKLDLAQDIDAAYDEHAGLEELLKKHRLLALARGPLSLRLRVLRLIQKKDPLNPVWSQDLETWERTRLTQINGEIPKLVQKPDRNGLLALVEELKETWIVPAAADARLRAQKAAEQVQAKWARAEMVNVASRLNAALVALDTGAGHAAREEWNGLAELARLSPDDPIVALTSEALDWLSGEDSFQEEESAYAGAMVRLEKTLDRKVSLAELNQRIYEVQKFEREIPEALASRAARKRAELEAGRKRRTMGLAAIAFVAMIGIGLAITFAIQQRGKNMQVADGLNRLSALNEQGDYAAAGKLHESLPEFVRNNPDVIKLWTEIDQAKQAMDTKDAQFRAAMDQAKTAGMDNPRMELIDQAKALADSQAESEEANIFERSVQQRQNTLMAERNSAFRSSLEKSTTDLRELENEGIADEELDAVVAIGREFDRLKSEHAGYVAKWPRVSPELLSQIEPLQQRVAGHVQNMQARRAQIDAFRTVTDSIGDWPGFLAALSDAANAAISPTQKGELELTASEADLWQGLVEWQNMASSDVWNRLSDLKPGEAKAVLERLGELDLKHSGFWLSQQTSGARDFMNELAALAPDAHQVAMDRLKETFGSRTLRKLYMVLEEDAGIESRFYCELEPKKTERGVSFDFLQDLQMLDTTPRASTTAGKLRYSGRAPQTRIADRVIKRIDEGGGSFEALCLDLLEIVLNDKPGKDEVAADPIVRVLMLKYILAEAVSASPSLGKLLEQFLHAVDETFVSRLDWVEPENADAKIRRQDCEELLARRAETLSNVKLNWENKRSQISGLTSWRQQAKMDWVGWMHQDSQGEWKLALKAEPDAMVSVFVLTAENGNPRSVKFREVGLYTDSKWQATGGKLIQSGRPVFCRAEDADKFASKNVARNHSRSIGNTVSDQVLLASGRELFGRAAD